MKISSRHNIANEGIEKPNALYRLQLFLYVFCYIVLTIAIIYLFLQKRDSFYNVNKYTISALISQGQLLAIVFITLTPIKRVHWVAITLCSISTIITLFKVISSDMLDILPGVFTPITSIIIGIVIYRYKLRSFKNGNEFIMANELLQKVLDTIPMPIFWKDLEFKFLGCNQYFAKEAGKSSPEQLIGKDDYATPSFEHTKKYIIDDAEITIRTSKVPLRDVNGEIFGLLGVFEDITKKTSGARIILWKRISKRLKW